MIFRIFHLSGKTFSKNDFSRAAKICLDGQELPKHVVRKLFLSHFRKKDV